MTKRIFSVLLALALAFSLIPGTAFAAWTTAPTVALTASEVSDNKLTVTMTVSASSPSVKAFNFGLIYDPTLVTVDKEAGSYLAYNDDTEENDISTGLDIAGVTDNFQYQTALQANGKTLYFIADASSKGFGKTGFTATVHFKLTETAIANGGTAVFSLANGTATLKGQTVELFNCGSGDDTIAYPTVKNSVSVVLPAPTPDDPDPDPSPVPVTPGDVPTVSLVPVSFTEGSAGPEEGETLRAVSPEDTFAVKVVLENGTGNTYHLGTFGVKFTYNSEAFELYSYKNAKSKTVGPVAFATEDQGGFDSGSYASKTNTGTTGEVYMSAIVSDTSEHALSVEPGGTVTLGYLMLKVKEGVEVSTQCFAFVPDGAVDKKNVVADVDMTTNEATTLNIDYTGTTCLGIFYREDQSPNVNLIPVSFTEGTTPVEGAPVNRLRRGDTFMLKVLFTNDMPEAVSLNAYRVEFHYDPNAFAVYSYSCNSSSTVGPVVFAPDWTGASNTQSSDVVIWTQAGAETRTVDPGKTAVLGYLMLKVKDSAEDTSYTFGFSLDGDKNYVISSNSNRIPGIDFTETNFASVDVVSYTLGDVNNKDGIDAIDALMTLQYVAELIRLDSIQYAAADVNRKDGVDALDALMILQYVAELIDSFD